MTFTADLDFSWRADPADDGYLDELTQFVLEGKGDLALRLVELHAQHDEGVLSDADFVMGRAALHPAPAYF